MAQPKYYYDSHTCSYQPVKRSGWSLLGRGLGFLVMVIVCAASMTFGYYTYFDSPKEVLLKQENETLRENYVALQEQLVQSHTKLAQLQERDAKLYRALLDAPLPSAAVSMACVEDPAVCPALLGQEELIMATVQKADSLKQVLTQQAQSYEELLRLAKKRKKLLASIPAIRPVASKSLWGISSRYGVRRDPFTGLPKRHEGMDFVARRGTPIYATGDGVVRRVVKGWGGGYGNNIEISHGNGFVTKYAHLSKVEVKSGQKVKRGQCIGKMGSTGRSTSTHLHYEVRKNGKKVNPAHYFFNDLNAEEYDLMLRLAAKDMDTPS